VTALQDMEGDKKIFGQMEKPDEYGNEYKAQQLVTALQEKHK
jgi:hypothetical protein